MVEQTDMERIGLFKEMPYITVNDPYHAPLQSTINRGLLKGRQILSEGSKMKAGTDDGYFLKPFIRLFEGEGESNIVKIRRQWRQDNSKRISTKPFIPSSTCHVPSGVGSRMGGMDNNLLYFSTTNRPEIITEKEKKGIYTSPGKKGTGYGYLDICLNPYPSAGLSDSYDRVKDVYYRKDREEHKLKSLNRNEFVPSKGFGDYFDINPYIDLNVQRYKEKYVKEPEFTQPRKFIPSSYPKKDGGCKAGTINIYPEHVKAEYKDKELRNICHDIRNNTRKLYNALPGSKSCIYQSILSKNVNFRVNNLNSHSIQRVMN